MSELVTSHRVSTDEAAVFLAPRDDVVGERADGVCAGGERRFVAASGPFSHYERRVAVEPDGDGRAVVTETINFRLAVPLWWVAFVGLYRRALRQRPRPGRQPWWAAPERLDPQAATVLGLLCSIAIVAGYLGTLITQTLTFAADEFEASSTAQGATLAAVRVGVLIGLVLAALADRYGRRRLLLASATAGCLFTVTGALAPNLIWLGASQTVARGFSGALLLLIGIVSAEEMPAGSRAYAVSLVTLTGALGAGMCLWVLPVADLDERAWRLIYVVPALGLLVVRAVGRRLPESRRFVTPHVEAPMAGHGRRFWLLAVSGFFLAVFAAPVGQFQNEFLRDERGYSAAAVSLFVVATSTPAGIGIVVGGRLADVYGRRLIAAVGIVGGTVGAVLMFASSGAVMWAWAIAGGMVAGLVVPALQVYRPELFPTSLRGKASGIIETITLSGSAAGLLIAGTLDDRWGGFAEPMALLALGPLAVSVLILAAYPETARQSLEDLNPEDRLPEAETTGDHLSEPRGP